MQNVKLSHYFAWVKKKGFYLWLDAIRTAASFPILAGPSKQQLTEKSLLELKVSALALE